MAYKLIIKTLDGNIIRPIVETYSVEEGFVIFKDQKDNNSEKRFPVNNVEIQVLEARPCQ